VRRRTAGAGRESGQVLLIALAFITFVGVVGVALLSYATTNLHATIVLRQLRSQEYSADGAVDVAINMLRNNTALVCGTTFFVAAPSLLNQQGIVVNCARNGGALPLDVTFTATCGNSGTSACPSGVALLVARVTFTGTAPSVATRVETWSVLT
jgi:hypothetical protein